MLLVMAIVMGVASSAAAQDSTSGGETLWLIEEADTDLKEEVFAGIEDALAAERGGHLLGREQLHERVLEGDDELWDCSYGVDECGSAEEMVFDALQLGLLVRLSVIDEGDDNIEINYEMVDRRGEVTSSGGVDAEAGRDLGLALVGTLFDAVGVVSFESTPSGAVVEVGQQELGKTPFSEQVEVGIHDYRMVLDGYDDAQGSFEVTSGEAKRLEVALGERPGRLRVHDAPEGATLWVNDEEYGRAVEVVDLEPGRHVVEVRAEGYETYRRSIELEPEQTKEVEAEMRAMPAFLRDIDASEIADHRFQFDAGFEIGRQRSEMHRARGEFDDDAVILQGWRADAEDPFVDTDDYTRRFVASPGFRVSAAWESDWFGLGLLSLSYSSQSMNEPVLLRRRGEELTGDEALLLGTVHSMRSLQIRPLQIRGRFFYENLAPWAQVGLGVDAQHMGVELDEGDSLRLGQTDAFASLEAGVRYHFDPRWSVGGSLRMQQYFDDGAGPKYSFGINVGMGLRDLPGLDSGPPGEL